MRRVTWDELHPEWTGRAYCPSCEMPVGERHQADCKGYPRIVTEGVRR